MATKRRRNRQDLIGEDNSITGFIGSVTRLFHLIIVCVFYASLRLNSYQREKFC